GAMSRSKPDRRRGFRSLSTAVSGGSRNRKDLSCPYPSLIPELRKNARADQPHRPLRTECFDSFSPPPGDSDVINEVDRLSSKETKIARRSVWMALGAAAR